jgi:5'-nucleotidase (lipoprotein e(P4) family)
MWSSPSGASTRTRLLPAAALLGAALAAACAHPVAVRPPAIPSPSPVQETPGRGAAADEGLNAVLWTQRAVEHDAVVREIYRAAGERLLAALDDRSWDALPAGEREGPFADLPPAIILDVDETLLDNSPYQAELVRSGREYDDDSWGVWCRKEAARPLPGALDFVRFAVERGVTPFYLTNRTVELGPATLSNLRKAGFPVARDDQFLGLGALLPGCEMVGTDKGCRRRMVARGHRVLMQLGDQIGDFVDVVANTFDGRRKELDAYERWVGERWWILPNPMYGGWEPATFDNDWSLSRERRRRAEIDALKVE